MGVSLRSRISGKGRDAPRGVVAPAGVKGWRRVSMYRMASAAIAGRFSHAACREREALCSITHKFVRASRSFRANSA
jgi:hypothetical protein